MHLGSSNKGNIESYCCNTNHRRATCKDKIVRLIWMVNVQSVKLKEIWM